VTAATVITGDCLAQLRAMPADCVDAVVTDPPWNLGKPYGAHDDAMPPDRYVEWLGAVLGQCRRVSRGAVVLLPGACNARHHLALLRRARLWPVATLLWRKPAAEPILWTVVPPPAHLAATICATEPSPGHPAFAGHPCPKPLALFERLVDAAVAPGGTVLDPFAGTGTTLLAAACRRRHAIGIELEPRFCRLAEHRIRSLRLLRPAAQGDATAQERLP
jgi:site-specific DNA-methyltransferase (adenine-specific)